MGLRDYLTATPLRLLAGDIWTNRPAKAALIYLRDSKLGPDTLSLIIQFTQFAPEWDLYLAVDCPETFEQNSKNILPQLETRGANITVVEEKSTAFLRGLWNSSLVFFTTRYDLWNYRICSLASSRTFIRIHHGIITKAYGNLRTSQLERQQRSRLSSRSYPSWLMPLSTLNVDAQSVESDVERFFRATAEGKQPAIFKKFGYPRYDRIHALRSGTVTPILPDDTRVVLESDTATYRFLYAPTHKDEAYKTTLFPFENFDLGGFKNVLETMDATMYVRMHPIEDKQGSYDEYIDGDRIRYAGSKFAQSPIEILPYIDALITDYSSIYVDFLPFDGPLVFLKDDHETFLETRGIAFDYDQYFPGEKIDTGECFIDHLQRCAAGEEEYSKQRSFVRQVFLPSREQTFLESIFDTYCTESVDG